ncbi:MAG: hypothetical protein QG635_287 [Bacteroidota bacterium]|nr:hypothetical protein [Bacteroidota bacterium]
MLIPSKIIAILTDFGISDIYVGVIKGVILNIAPDTNIIDITHEIQPQNIKQAAFLLKDSYTYFPEGTIFLAVVDPGVGSNRKPIAVRTEKYYFIGPDNGVLSFVLEEAKEIDAVKLNNPKYLLDKVCNTFHGRDIFAPAAAHLAAGVPFNDLGSSAASGSLNRFGFIKYYDIKDNLIAGEVVHIDRFGNIISSIDKDFFDYYCKGNDVVTYINSNEIDGIMQTFSNAAQGDLLVYFGSGSHIEIAARNDNAARILGAKIGDRIYIKVVS